MTGFFDLTQKIKTTLEADPFVNTISSGSLDNVDINKQTIFPLSHIMVNNCSISKSVLTFNVSVMCMDIVDESKSETTNIFRGNDNEQDVLNTQLGVLDRLIALLQRGDLYTDLYQVEGNVTCEPFTDRFENKLAGWVATFDVQTKNEMTVC